MIAALGLAAQLARRNVCRELRRPLMHVSKYFKIFDIGLQNTVTYRWNFLLRSLFDVVPLLGTVYLWRALFASRGSAIGGYEFNSMVYYFLLTILASNLITPTDDEWQIASDIREGQLNALLVKPINYLAYRISLFLGYRAIYSVVTLPLVVVLFACFHSFVTVPHHALTWLLDGDLAGDGGVPAIFPGLRGGLARLLAAGNLHRRFSSSTHSSISSAATCFRST